MLTTVMICTAVDLRLAVFDAMRLHSGRGSNRRRRMEIDTRMPSERRFLIIAADGRAATASREVEPDEETLDNAAEGLDAVGLGGWLAVLDVGDGDGSPQPRPLRRVTATPAAWEQVEAAYHARLSGRSNRPS